MSPTATRGPDRRTRRAGWSAAGSRVARVLTWTLCLVAVTVTALRWVDVAASPVVLLQSLSPLAAPVALVALGGALVRGRWTGRAALSSGCVLVLAVHAAIWAPWLTDETPRPGSELTIMTANLFLGRADAATIGRVVRARDVDILVLSEVRNSADANLRRYGVYRQLPHAFPSARSPAGTVILSRVPMTAVAGPANQAAASSSDRNPVARLRYGNDITLRAVHPVPPVTARVRRWRTTLSHIAEWAQRTHGPLIVAGDFNSSVDHPAMREILESGLRDSHEVAGAGRPPTWPNGRSVPAFVQIDHVLVRGIDVASAEELRIPGTDHDALLVELRVPAAQ